MATRFVELNHVLEHGMPVFGNLPRPRFEAILTHEQSRPHYSGKAEFYLGKFEMAANTGTYMDSPFHRFRDGQDFSQIPLDRLAGLPGIVVDGSMGENLAVSLPSLPRDIRGAAILVRTGWDSRWGTDSYWEAGPYLSDDTVTRLLDGGAALVGVDFVNVDNTKDPARPVHTRLLQAGIIVVEHLCNLADLPATGFSFYAVPLRIVGGAACPVRAFAQIP